MYAPIRIGEYISLEPFYFTWVVIFYTVLGLICNKTQSSSPDLIASAPPPPHPRIIRDPQSNREERTCDIHGTVHPPAPQLSPARPSWSPSLPAVEPRRSCCPSTHAPVPLVGHSLCGGVSASKKQRVKNILSFVVLSLFFTIPSSVSTSAALPPCHLSCHPYPPPHQKVHSTSPPSARGELRFVGRLLSKGDTALLQSHFSGVH